MNVKHLLAFIALMLLTVPSINFASQDMIEEELVHFRINLIVPISSAVRRGPGCQYSTDAPNMWIRSSAKGSERSVAFREDGTSLSDSNCQFTSSLLPLDVNSYQTIFFNKHELFTMTPKELAGKNVIVVEFEEEGYGRHELLKEGVVIPFVPTPTPEPTPMPNPEAEFQFLAQIQGVENAQAAFFSDSTNEPLFTGSSFIVNTYTFGSDSKASDSFPAICEHAAKQISNLTNGGTSREISMGHLGDETCAYIDGKKENELWIATRKDNYILTVFALSENGDTVELTADWLDGYLSTLPDDYNSLMPVLTDLPRGWSQVGDTEDVTKNVMP